MKAIVSDVGFNNVFGNSFFFGSPYISALTTPVLLEAM